MTQSLSLPLLLILSCLSLAGLGLSGMMVARTQQQRQKVDVRLAAAVTPHMRPQRLALSAFTPPVEKPDSLLALATRLFAFDPAKNEQYGVHWAVVLFAALGLALVAQMLAAGILGSLAPLTVPFTWVVLSRNYFIWSEGRRKNQLFVQFPDALTMIVRSVRVGIPVMEGMRMVSREAPQPTQREFVQMLEQVAVGVTMEDALQDMARRCGLTEYRFFATALALQNQTGGALSETLEGLAEVIRKRVALRARGHALASEGKMSAIVLSALPVVTGIMLWILNPKYMSPLFTDQTGHKILTASILSLSVGLFTMRAMIRRSLS